MGHHSVTTPHGVAQPLRDTSWWHRRKQESNCLRALGHCWHAVHGSMTEWFCCTCAKLTKGMPSQNCAICTRRDGHVA